MHIVLRQIVRKNILDNGNETIAAVGVYEYVYKCLQIIHALKIRPDWFQLLQYMHVYGCRIRCINNWPITSTNNKWFSNSENI